MDLLVSSLALVTACPTHDLFYEVDEALVRDLGWTSPGASDEEVLAAVARRVSRRLLAFGLESTVVAGGEHDLRIGLPPELDGEIEASRGGPSAQVNAGPPGRPFRHGPIGYDSWTMIPSLLLPLLALPLPQDAPDQEPVTYMGMAYVFRADLERGRAAGWIDDETEDEDVLAGIATGIEARLRQNAGRFPEARVTREADGHFAVTFVGPMGEAFDSFLVPGLASPARMALHAAPSAEDLAALGLDLEAEHERAATWRAEHPDDPWAVYSRVPRDSGGPHEALDWLHVHGEPRPVPVLRGESLPLLPADLERHQVWPGEDGLRYVLGLTLKCEPRAAVTAFAEELGAREAVFAMDDKVRDTLTADDLRAVRVEEPSPEDPETEPSALDPGPPLVLDMGMDTNEARSMILALAGEPFGAPLVFVERSKRPLSDVAR